MEYGTDPIFLEKLTRKDVLACKQLYMQYADAMYNVCVRILQHQAEAEDALQEAFIKIFENIHQFRNESSIGSWMKQVVTNTCLNVLRKKKIVLTDIDEQVAELQDDDEKEEPAADYSTEEIKAAIAQLPQGYSIIFNLYMFEEYSHKQIAALLEISESTTKSQLFKAKRKLKEILLQKKKDTHG